MSHTASLGAEGQTGEYTGKVTIDMNVWAKRPVLELRHEFDTMMWLFVADMREGLLNEWRKRNGVETL